MVKKKIKDERNFIPSVGPPQILQVLCVLILILLQCTNLVVTGCSNILSSDFGCSHILTGKPALSSHLKEDKNWFSRPVIAYCMSKVLQNAPRGAFCNSFGLH